MKRLISIFCILLALAPTVSLGFISELDKAQFLDKNQLTNPGFEGQINSGWGATPAHARVTAAANKRSGNASISWDASAASQSILSGYLTITSGGGLSGANGEAACYIKTASGTATHTIQAYDGTNILASATINSSTSGFVRSSVLFPFPASGTVALRIVSAADEPVIYVDDCYLGPPTRLMDLSTITAWANYTPTTSGFGTTTGDDFQWARIGNSIVVTANFTTGTVTGSNAKISFPNSLTFNSSIWAGSNSIIVGKWIRNAGSATQRKEGVIIVNSGDAGNLLFSTGDYTSAINPLTAQAGNALFGNTEYISVAVTVPIPITGWSAETAFRPEEVGGVWSGYHDSTCSWARTNVAFGSFTADATCALVEQTNVNFGTVTTTGSATPGVTFTPKRAGKYLVVATAMVHADSASQNPRLRLTDGTTHWSEIEVEASSNARRAPTLQAIVTASSTSPVSLEIQGLTGSGAVNINTNGARAVNWSIAALSYDTPAPLLVNSVTNTSTGLTRVEAARLNCDAASSIVSQQGSWVSSIGNNGGNSCTVTITSGIFSSTPYCTGSWYDASTGTSILAVTPSSATSVVIKAVSHDNTDDSAFDMTLNCIGPR